MKEAVRSTLLLGTLAGAVALLACNGSTAPDPNVPSLIAPAANAVLDNGCVPNGDSLVWDFDWSDVPGATKYELTVLNTNAIFAEIDDSTLTASSYHYSKVATYTNLTTGWLWWARAYVNGSWQAWAGPRAFSVEAVSTDCP